MKVNLVDSFKNFVILLKIGYIIELIICYVYEKIYYSGRGVILNEFCLNGYWIINGNVVVRCFILRCVRCCYLCGIVGE